MASVYSLRNIARTSQHQVIVLFCIGSTHLQQGLVLLAIVTTDSQVSTQPFWYLHVDTCTVVPTIVVQFTKITILVEVRDTSKVTHIVRSSTHIHRMSHGGTSLPILVQQIVVQVLHSFQLICLIQGCGMVQGSVRRISSRHAVIQTAILIRTQHLRTGHFIGETELSTIGDTGLTHLTFLRRNEDNSVSSAGTINGCRGIFQHRDALHFGRIKIIESLCT